MTEMENKLKSLLEAQGEKTDNLIKQMSETVKAENAEKYNELKKSVDESMNDYMETFKKLQNHVDSLETQVKKSGESLAEKHINFATVVAKAMDDNMEEFKNWISTGRKGSAIEMELKASPTTQADLTGRVIEDQRVQGIIYDPERAVRVRSLLNVAGTNSPLITFVKESAFTDGTAMTGEALAYGATDFEMTEASENVRKVGATVDISNEMLEDLPALVGYLNARLPEKLMNVEDTQILTGDNTGQNLNGIITQASAFADPGADFTDANATHWDVLRIAIKQATADEYRPTAILLHPDDCALMDLEKGSDGHYIFPMNMTGSGQKTVSGIPIIENTAISSGTFLLGDFRNGCQLFSRRGATIEFSRENNDNFDKDMTTVRISERVALCVYRPSAFISHTFSGAKTLLAT